MGIAAAEPGNPTPAAVPTPTIKGVFVNSHVEAVRRQLGEPGVEELASRFGGSVDFRSGDDVPVRDEVRIIEYALDLLHDDVPPQEREFEAGRLHFRNFTTTPWAKMLFSLFPKNFKFMILHAKTVAERVFRGVTFESNEIEPNTVLVVMENNDYPIDHFRGLFHEWMQDFGYDGRVSAHDAGSGRYEYTITWT